MRKKTTIKDIALAAGVSTQTVSRVLNNRPDVSSDTRKRVMDVINRLNYSPSIFAHWLRKDTINTESRELDKVIDWALLNGTIDQEKAAWLREGLDKGFIG